MNQSVKLWILCVISFEHMQQFKQPQRGPWEQPEFPLTLANPGEHAEPLNISDLAVVIRLQGLNMARFPLFFTKAASTLPPSPIAFCNKANMRSQQHTFATWVKTNGSKLAPLVSKSVC